MVVVPVHFTGAISDRETQEAFLKRVSTDFHMAKAANPIRKAFAGRQKRVKYAVSV